MQCEFPSQGTRACSTESEVIIPRCSATSFTFFLTFKTPDSIYGSRCDFSIANSNWEKHSMKNATKKAAAKKAAPKKKK